MTIRSELLMVIHGHGGIIISGDDAMFMLIKVATTPNVEAVNVTEVAAI